MKKLFPFVFIAIVTFIFFWQFIFKGLLPIPSDTIVGLYHPFRDLYVKDYPRGIPFKNFLITDPVRQQYPWRNLSIEQEKKGELPLWNPYNFSGTPLLANFQSGALYPLNVIFFMLPFYIAWSILIILGVFLAGLFTFLYLENLKLSRTSAILGSFAFSFSGFFVAWLEWGTVLHTALWIPLILLSIDKILTGFQENLKFKIANLKLQFKIKNYLVWGFVFTFSLISAFLAGHLQTFFYIFLLSLIYFFVRWFQYGGSKKVLLLFAICYLLFTLATAIQWIPTLQFILESGRSIDQTNWQKVGWFIPWQNLIQFIAPDFFGNPTTLNYWGIFNYAEFAGYIGIVPLIMGVFAIFFRRDKKTLFFGTVFFISLIFSLPTFFAKLPNLLNIPFISTAQPTRLLFITDFSLAVLAAFGFDYFLKRKAQIIYPLGFMGFIFIALWLFVFFENTGLISPYNLLVAKRNLIFPTGILIISSILIFFLSKFSKNKRTTLILCCIIVAIVLFDLLRFGLKFSPFTKKEYLFPNTSTISFLQKKGGEFRIMTDDSRIFPPNFSSIYKIQSVDGYDPLYVRRYGELIAASERGEPNIDPPFGFNRIITPHNYSSEIMDLLGVRYVLSLSDLSSEKLDKAFQEGQLRIYENKNAFPRAFFVENVLIAKNKNEAINKIFEKKNELRKVAVVESSTGLPSNWTVGKVEILNYEENRIVLKSDNSGDGFMVLTETFYPTWHAKIDGAETKIYLTDFNFRGIVVPKGKHKIEFYMNLL